MVMVHAEVAGLKNGELVMGGILEDCKDRMGDRLLRSHIRNVEISNCIQLWTGS